MNKSIIFLLITFLSFAFLNAQPANPAFDDYFVDETLRIDYHHMADKTNEFFSLDKMYRQGTWAGNPLSLLDPFNNGRYYIKIYDAATDTLIYSKGFGSYCGEYITTDMAANGIKRTYHETAIIPFPKKKIKFTIEKRDKKNVLHKDFEQTIDPESVDIIKEPLCSGVIVHKFLENGSPHQKVDLAIIADGYTKDEFEKFKNDLKMVMETFFNHEPYKTNKNQFNVYGVFKASQDSGTDEPTKGIFKNTAVGSTFNALGLFRYNLTEENRALRDIAAHVPYDALVIMVNSERYGGGGIYNSYCLFCLNPEKYNFLFLHEFGHSFGGLADEYFSSDVAYNDFYPVGIEPLEPNITALLEPDQLKWKHLVTKGTPIPTPWGKEAFDKMDYKQKTAHIHKEEFKGIIGAYEGAGYSSTGLYRPCVDCLMHTSLFQPYCKVCEAAVTKMIQYYSTTK